MSDLEITPLGKTATATFNGEVIARSDAALLLKEGAYNPVLYFPKKDIKMDLLVSSDKTSLCPKKGDASYWSVQVGDKTGENAAWAYDDPSKEQALPLKDHIAFYNFVVKIEG